MDYAFITNPGGLLDIHSQKNLNWGETNSYVSPNNGLIGMQVLPYT